MSKLYLVGGAVRDRLLHLPVNERDWVVVGSTPDELLSQGYQQVGKDFPVFLHPKTKEEYALARTERKSGQGYTGFICDFDKTITLEQDLIRRDLTINAIAEDLEGKLHDPYHGIDDLHQKILRHISPAFREDPLRVLRVARFAARFHHLGFTIADETMDLMREIVASGEMEALTAERVWRETEKALSTQDPQIYFLTLKHCNALPILFPNLILTPPILAALQQIVHLTNEKEVRFAVLCAKFESSELVKLLCNKIKAPNSYCQTAIMAQKFIQTVINIKQLSAKEILNLLNAIDVWRNPHHLQQLILISQAYYCQKKGDYFPQGDYLNQAYQIAKSINVQLIISQGFTGKDISSQLQKSRIEALLRYI
ncbi:hypothetical protein PT276_08680 [Orbaceae bacterium ESL0721]|nr:hypothetical protein [Orbaceae bacterium ESL0721]